MRRLGFVLVSMVGLLSMAACTVNSSGDGKSPSPTAPNSTTSPSPSAPPSSTSTNPGSVPAASTADASIAIDGTCPSFNACGGTLSGTYDYASGCVAEVFNVARQQCPTLDTSNAKVTVKGSLHFIGSALTRDAVSTTSGSIVVPITCSQGQCSAVEDALRSSFDSVSCTGSSSCTCTIKRTDVVKNATTFTLVGDTVTTADGDTYAICEQAGTLRYKGKSVGAEDGSWELKKR